MELKCTQGADPTTTIIEVVLEASKKCILTLSVPEYFEKRLKVIRNNPEAYFMEQSPGQLPHLEVSPAQVFHVRSKTHGNRLFIMLMVEHRHSLY
jgi:hypothetical protein